MFLFDVCYQEVDILDQKTPKTDPAVDTSTIIHPLSPEADHVTLSQSMSASVGDKVSYL